MVPRAAHGNAAGSYAGSGLTRDGRLRLIDVTARPYTFIGLKVHVGRARINL